MGHKAPLRASTPARGYSSKIKKKCSNLHILPQNSSTSVYVKMFKYTRLSCKMNSNRTYIHGYCSPCKQFFNIIFSPLSNDFSSPTITTTQRDRITTKPSATTKHRNLAECIKVENFWFARPIMCSGVIGLDEWPTFMTKPRATKPNLYKQLIGLWVFSVGIT